MFEIDRAVIIVRPKQPFLDWSQTIDYDPDMTLDEVREDPSVYLIPEYLDDAEQAEVLEAYYEVVFEAQLEGWYIDPSLWPEQRDLEMFRAWFDVEFHSLVFDLCDAPIQVVDYETEDDDPVPGSNGN
jgi:hypothetical protein